MQLNHFSHALIALVPLILGWIWYKPTMPWVKWASSKVELKVKRPSVIGFLILYCLSGALVFVYMNLIIHQIGFYELFFTDIMRGSEESKQIAEEFLAVYGQKHRHLGHGLFHGLIDAFALALPFLVFYNVVEKVDWKRTTVHFGFWVLCSTLIGGLVAEFV